MINGETYVRDPLQQQHDAWRHTPRRQDTSNARDAHYGGQRVRRERSQPSTDGTGGRSVVVDGERSYARGEGPGEATGAGAAHGVPNDTPRQYERPGEARTGGKAATGGLSWVFNGVTIHTDTVEVNGMAIYAHGEPPFCF